MELKETRCLTEGLQFTREEVHGAVKAKAKHSGGCVFKKEKASDRETDT